MNQEIIKAREHNANIRGLYVDIKHRIAVVYVDMNKIEIQIKKIIKELHDLKRDFDKLNIINNNTMCKDNKA